MGQAFSCWVLGGGIWEIRFALFSDNQVGMCKPSYYPLGMSQEWNIELYILRFQENLEIPPPPNKEKKEKEKKNGLSRNMPGLNNKNMSTWKRGSVNYDKYVGSTPTNLCKWIFFLSKGRLIYGFASFCNRETVNFLHYANYCQLILWGVISLRFHLEDGHGLGRGCCQILVMWWFLLTLLAHGNVP